MSKTVDIKELVKRLQRVQGAMANEEEDAVLDAIGALEAMAGDVLAAEKRNLESSMNALGWMRLSDALKHIIWKYPEAAKEMMAADLPPLPAPEDAVKLVAERDRLKAALGKIGECDHERVTKEVYRRDGAHSKLDKCDHGRRMYEDCDECTAAFARSALEAKP